MRHAVLLKTTARPFTQKQLHSIRQGKVLIHIGTQRDTPKFLVHSRSSLSDTWLASPDYEKERSELFGLAIFGHRDWKKHKEEDRYLRHVGSLARSRILQGIGQPLAGVTALAFAEVLYEVLRKNGSLPAGYPTISLGSVDPFNITSFALSILLVFRTQASYDRWVEARELWGGVVVHTRDIIQKSSTRMMPQEERLARMLQRWVTAFPYTLKCHLQAESNLQEELQAVLHPQEMECLERASHRPGYVVGMIDQVVAGSQAYAKGELSCGDNLAFFNFAIGNCERIFKTPIPLSWTRHTSRFLIIWLAFLPLALFPLWGWSTVPVTTMIAFLLLGIEEIGVQIEEPFAILPLDHFSRIIESSIAEVLALQSERKELVVSQMEGEQ